jgi:GTP cyclohydrolase FolE2
MSSDLNLSLVTIEDGSKFASTVATFFAVMLSTDIVEMHTTIGQFRYAKEKDQSLPNSSTGENFSRILSSLSEFLEKKKTQIHLHNLCGKIKNRSESTVAKSLLSSVLLHFKKLKMQAFHSCDLHRVSSRETNGMAVILA